MSVIGHLIPCDLNDLKTYVPAFGTPAAQQSDNFDKTGALEFMYMYIQSLKGFPRELLRTGVIYYLGSSFLHHQIIASIGTEHECH
jgi:hypothetical protein